MLRGILRHIRVGAYCILFSDPKYAKSIMLEHFVNNASFTYNNMGKKHKLKSFTRKRCIIS